MARKTKTNTRNLARRIATINRATQGRMTRLIEAIEYLADLKREHAVLEENFHNICDRNDAMPMTQREQAAADKVEANMCRMLDALDDDISAADEAVQTAADDLAMIV